MRFLTILSCAVLFSTLGLLWVLFYDQMSELAIPLFLIATGAVMVLLVRGFNLMSEIQASNSKDIKAMLRVHIILHIFPVAYLALKLFVNPQSIFEIIWLAPFIVFFYTGRRSWIALHESYHSKMYYIFIRGNTGMLFMLSILSVLSVLAVLIENPVQWNVATRALSFNSIIHFLIPDEFASRILTIYFTIHFILIGIAVIKIEQDVGNNCRSDESR